MTQPTPPSPPAPTKKPFAYQAAQVALWAPLIALFIGIGANSALRNTSGASSDSMTRIAWIIVGGFNLLLLLLGLVMGIVALVGASRHKFKGIVGRAVAGIVISVLFLGAAASLPFVMRGANNRAAARLVGQWHATLRPPGAVAIDSTLSFDTDKHATVRFTVGAKTVTGAGTWAFRMGNADQRSQLLVRWDPGQDPSLGDGILWSIERIEDTQLTLLGKNADGSQSTEIYQRVKP
jgi:hypothetical protein